MIRDRMSWRDTSSKGGALAGATSINSGWHTTHGVFAIHPNVSKAMWPNVLYTAPYYVSNSETHDRIGVDVLTGGSQMILGLYYVGCATSMLPGVLAAQTSPMSVGAAGICAQAWSAQLHDRTLWWFAMLAVSSVTVTGFDHAYDYPVFGYDPVSFSVAYTAVVASWAYATGLPTVFPASVTYVGSVVPTVGVTLLRHG